MNSTRSLRLPPQVGQPSNTSAMMGDVLVALLPTTAMAVFFFGFRVLVLAAVSIGSCLLFEFLYRRLTGQSDTLRDLSACVTGLLLALSLPATAAYWVPILGAAFAIVVVKQFYGGLGKNFMNPALAGRMLLATFPVLMTNWSRPLDRLPLLGVDAVSAATPLSYLHAGTLPPQTPGQLFLGQQGGCMGEVSAVMLLLGGLYLILRRNLAEIRFIKPNLHFTLIKGGKMPGEEHLDQIRAQAKALSCLGAVILATGLVIFGVHRFTDLDTARAETEAQQELLSQVMPQAAFSSEIPYRAVGALSIQAGYSEDNELVGYCVEIQAHGFGGVVTMEVGVDLDGRVTGVAVTDHKETSGVGTEAMTPAALRRYVGKSGTIRSSGANSVDAVSGATATSQAITAGVNRALAIVANLDLEGGDVSYVDGEV